MGLVEVAEEALGMACQVLPVPEHATEVRPKKEKAHYHDTRGRQSS